MYLGDSADTRRCRKRLDDFLAVEMEQHSDRPIYTALLVVGAILLYVFGGTPWAIVAILPFFVLDRTFSRHCRRASAPGLATGSTYWRLRAHHLAMTAAFAVFVNVVAHTPGYVSAWAAGLLVFGQALNCIGHETRSREAALFGIAAVSVVALSAAYGIASAAGSDDRTIVFVILSTLLLAVYFGHVVRNAAAIREDLLQRTTALHHAQKGEAVGRLTSGIAHDFNNILTVMRGNIDLLDEVPEPERAPLIREIGAAADRGGRLVSQLLATVRRGERHEEVVVLREFLATFAAFARRVLPANVELVTEVEHGLTVSCDTAQLDSALLNLVVNARDAMPDGGTVTICARSGEAPAALRRARVDRGGEAWVEVCVQDDGPGMPPEVLARATEPFMTTKPAGRGTGLGLSMVREFADGAGGLFELGSEVGRGTTARILLPV